jgi:hypothetical protein
MNDKKKTFNFWYAINNTEIVLVPSQNLETFGTTMLNYTLISQDMDNPTKTKVRKGKMLACKPQIIMPHMYINTILEGFGEEAEQYVKWLEQNEKELKIIQYGYNLKQEAFSEYEITDNIETVVERARKEIEESRDKLMALVVGVDQPWDVSLLKLFSVVTQNSAEHNFKEMLSCNLFDDINGTPKGIQDQIDKKFLEASRDGSKINDLAEFLKLHNIFEKHEDRFFSLVKNKKRYLND